MTLPMTLALALALPSAASPTTAATAQADCTTTWGSLVKRQAPRVTGQVSDVRSGRHRCFDRLVIDLGEGGRRPGFRVQYVDTVRADGSGAAVPLRGGARLQVVVTAPAYDDQGQATYQPGDPRELVDVTGYDTFRQVAWAGTFEGTTTVGLGVRARLPMRAFTLAGPDGGHRVVVDVAHRW
jgi:hypothetical protein